MSIWENVNYLDEYSVNIIQLFNKEKNEMLIVTKESDAFIDFVHLKVTPEFDKNNKLVYIEDAEDIERLSYDEDEQYEPFVDLILFLIKD